MKIIIDAGHGGSDPGAAALGYNEKDLNLIYANLLAEKLTAFGHIVDRSLIMDANFSSDELTARIRQSGAALCISCHNNAFNGLATGFEVIYSIHSDGELANLIGNAVASTGYKVHRLYTREGESAEKKGKDYYYVIRQTYPSVETLIVEFGFMDNPSDLEHLVSQYWQDTLTKSVASAINTYAVRHGQGTTAPLPPIPPQTTKHWAQDDNDALLAAGILKNDHSKTLDSPATEAMVISMVNRLRHALGGEQHN